MPVGLTPSAPGQVRPMTLLKEARAPFLRGYTVKSPVAVLVSIFNLQACCVSTAGLFSLLGVYRVQKYNSLRLASV